LCIGFDFSFDRLSGHKKIIGTGNKGSNSPSVRSSVLDEERIRTGNWLSLVLCVSFSALTLMIGWQEVHPSHNNTISLTNLHRFCSRMVGEG